MDEETNENECALDGVRYVAQRAPTCRDCAAYHDDPESDLCRSLPPCSALTRRDDNSIIWVRVQ